MKKTYAIFIIILLLIIVFMPKSFAIKPNEITGDIGDETTLDLDFVDKLSDLLKYMGTLLAVGVLMVIGIKYMTGSIEEKAQYKKTMMPYIIGCFFLFSASIIGPKIVETFKDTNDMEDLGNNVLGLIQVIGSFLAVGVLMILGIKYMMGSVEEKASYKKTMLPYFIGAVLIFGGVNISAVIVNMVTLEEEKVDPGIKPVEEGRCPKCNKKGTMREKNSMGGVVKECISCGYTIRMPKSKN